MYSSFDIVTVISISGMFPVAIESLLPAMDARVYGYYKNKAGTNLAFTSKALFVGILPM